MLRLNMNFTISTPTQSIITRQLSFNIVYWQKTLNLSGRLRKLHWTVSLK